MPLSYWLSHKTNQKPVFPFPSPNPNCSLTPFTTCNGQCEGVTSWWELGWSEAMRQVALRDGIALLYHNGVGGAVHQVDAAVGPMRRVGGGGLIILVRARA
jgi:hypothetical protein